MMGEADFRQVRSLTKHILENRHGFQWSLQGLGMLRCSLPSNHRLHVWYPAFAWVKDAILHTHPWSFKSGIISGTILNTRFKAQERDELWCETWKGMTIKCGPGGCAMSEAETYHLLRMPTEVWCAGSHYEQAADEIHLSQPTDGTVSIIERLNDTEIAKVFWPVGKSWDSAEPRPPTREELDEACEFALMGFK